MTDNHQNDDAQALGERLARIEAAVDATGLGLWEWDVRSGRIVWNARNCELFGVDGDGPLTIQDYVVLVHPDDRDIVRDAYREALAAEGDARFVFEHRTARSPDGRVRWLQASGRVFKSEDGVRLVVGSTLDVTGRRTAEERRMLVLGELAHRAKNGVQILMALVAHGARGAETVEAFQAKLLERLQAMSASQDLVTNAPGDSLKLPELFAKAFEPFDRARFEIDPRLEEISVPSEMVVGMALLLHELATNALKYGALSSPRGCVHLGLEIEGHAATLLWREHGGPAVSAPVREGFGSRLLRVALRNIGGRAEGHFTDDGFCAEIHFPLRAG